MTLTLKFRVPDMDVALRCMAVTRELVLQTHESNPFDGLPIMGMEVTTENDSAYYTGPWASAREASL